MNLWHRIHKGDTRGREMADHHYTRQSPGHPMWTRPGYNFVLHTTFASGSALFCWWRPKWEDSRPGTKRKDGLQVIECTMFRCEGKTPLASSLIREAVNALYWGKAKADLKLEKAGQITHLITGISSKKTAARRSSASKPGCCFRHAGWSQFEKRGGKADVWLCLPWRNPEE